MANVQCLALAIALLRPCRNYPVSLAFWTILNLSAFLLYFKCLQQFQNKSLLLHRLEAYPWVRLPRFRQERKTSTLVGRPTPLYRRKKLQKMETSIHFPKKILKYEVSQWGTERGDQTGLLILTGFQQGEESARLMKGRAFCSSHSRLLNYKDMVLQQDDLYRTTAAFNSKDLFFFVLFLPSKFLF